MSSPTTPPGAVTTASPVLGGDGQANRHPPGLHLHRAESSATLAGSLAALLATPAEDPLAPEIVAIPTAGVERWLAQELSATLGATNLGGDGICAGVEFPGLGSLLHLVVAESVQADPADDPWRSNALTWSILSVLNRSWDRPWFAPLARHLGGSGDDELRPGRRFTTASRLARLFSSYAQQRPTLIGAWRRGENTDGWGQPLPAELAWQPHLWRAVAEHIADQSTRGDGAGDSSILRDPVQRTRAAVGALAHNPGLVALPTRLSIFGPTRLTSTQIALLGALGRHREVHLWLPHPSPTLWGRVRSEVAPALDTGSVRRSADPSRFLPQHRLNARLGRDLRELQLRIQPHLGSDEHLAADQLEPPRGEAETTLLARLQAAIAADAEPSTRRPLSASDASITLHSSHGPDRQVEVLREVITGLLEDDPSLEPRDIVVLCPDVELYAPLITANFGAVAEDGNLSSTHPGQQLRVRLADRSAGQTNPLLGLLRQLLDLGLGRATRSQLLDLCAAEPIARRFGLSDDALVRVSELVSRSGVRWGVDPAGRGAFSMAGFGQNTWLSGMDRMLTGVAFSEDDLPTLGTALPLDDVDSQDIELVGKVSELILRLREFVHAAGRSHSLDGWVSLLKRAVDQLTAAAPDQAWQVSHAYALLGRLSGSTPNDDKTEHDQTEHDQLETDPPGQRRTLLTPGDLRALFASLLEPRPSRSNFRTGALTVCTLSPMRSVPHRVVCLLGLDDGVFPRGAATDGDDLLARDPIVGEFDRRSEDRQLLLDAVGSAGEKLVVVYSGADLRTNAPRPAAVPVQELFDAIDETATAPAGSTETAAKLTSWITTRHPLQPYSTPNFDPGFTAGHPGFAGRPISFDELSLAAATAGRRVRSAPPSARLDAIAWPPTEPPQAVELGELHRFFRHPAQSFLRQRLGLATWTEENDPTTDEIPIALDGLQRWQLGERVLRLAMAGAGQDEIRRAEWLRGQLPPRRFGESELDRTMADVGGILGQIQPIRGVVPSSQDVALRVTPAALGLLPVDANALRLSGLIGGIYDHVLDRVSFSRVSAKQLLPAWIDLVSLTVARPEREWRAAVVGKGGAIWLGPIPPERAEAVLSQLCGLFLAGLDSPLALPPRTALAYARTARSGQDWRDTSTVKKQFEYEFDDVWARLVSKRVDELFTAQANPELREVGRHERSRFGALARLVWEPILDVETTY